MSRLPGRARRVGVLVAPWSFVIAFAWVWSALLVPKALEGQVALACVTLVAGLALASFIFAAVTFSRDVVRGRWPSSDV